MTGVNPHVNCELVLLSAGKKAGHTLTSTPPNCFATMPKGTKQAESTNKKTLAKQKEAAIQCTVELYKSGVGLSLESQPGYRMVCRTVEDELGKETGVKVKLCHNTVCARLNGVFGDPVTNASFAHQDFTNLSKHSRHKEEEEATSIAPN